MADNNENEKTEYFPLFARITPSAVNKYAREAYKDRIGNFIVLAEEEYAIFPMGETFVKRFDGDDTFSFTTDHYVYALIPKNFGTANNPRFTKSYSEGMSTGNIEDAIDKLLKDSSTIGHIDLREMDSKALKQVI